MKLRLASPLTTDSVVDGKGLRTVIWCQGCIHGCHGCHNTATHDLDAGYWQDIEEVAQEVLQVKLQSGVTFSGGDPMLQAAACAQLAHRLKEQGVNIWCYTGFLFEELLQRPDCREFLQYIDVLVDGPFVAELKSYDLLFKGSANQRLIDVPASLAAQTAVLCQD